METGRAFIPGGRESSQRTYETANSKRTIMWEWIASNHQVMGVLANIAMLLVWIAYLQVFVSSYRRQKRPSILINRGAGSGLEARCLISNMSAEVIYIETLIATVETTEGRWSCPVTELLEGRSDLKLATRQGPLQTGHFVDIGSFQRLIEPVLQRRAGLRGAITSDDLESLVAFEIKVIAVHGSEDLLAGATRRFDLIRSQGQLLLKGHAVGTQQIRSRRKRERLLNDVKVDL
ncbi:hypothetical protein [Microvirga roseola]|uniref:hypothetical protein n=1 Tax=Microvirga roseola TaxID=2883126 RepID=UPI001E584944|nr:hypothetical protein [Microvirga roseola]